MFDQGMLKTVMRGCGKMLEHARPVAFALTACLAVATHAQTIYVSSPQDLDNVRNDLDADYIQTAHIDLNGYTLDPIGDVQNPFTGTYNGGNYEIRNHTYDALFTNNIGLFGVANGATFSNVRLRNFNVKGGLHTGGLVADLMDGEVTNCTIAATTGVTCEIKGTEDVGGLVGRCHESLVEDCIAFSGVTVRQIQGKWGGGIVGHVHIGSTVRYCSSAAFVKANRGAGGIAGNIHGSTIEGCYSRGLTEANQLAGGICGFVQFDQISSPSIQNVVRNCEAHGQVNNLFGGLIVDGPIIAVSSVGGLIGWVDPNAYIETSTATGDIYVPTTATDVKAGGLIGFMVEDTVVYKCTAYGSIPYAHHSGGLVGYCLDCTVDHCSAYGEVHGDSQVGGLVGSMDGGVCIDSHAYGDVSAVGSSNGHAESGHLLAAVGGLLGYTFPGATWPGTTVQRCSAHGNVTSEGQGTGGLIGLCWGTLLTESYSTGEVSSTDRRTGGLCGIIPSSGTSTPTPLQRVEIYNCYSTSPVSNPTSDPGSQGQIGGLVGLVKSTSLIVSRIENCYSAGLVNSSSSTAGGLIGQKEAPAVVVSSYWDTQTSGQSSSAGGTGKTTAQMYDQATYSGWDFINIWAILQNQNYPYLIGVP